MSDNWLDGIAPDDLAELQAKGNTVAEGREAFMLVIPVGLAQHLVEEYVAVGNGNEDAHVDCVNYTVHEMVMQLYEMCVELGVLEPNFWKPHEA